MNEKTPRKRTAKNKSIALPSSEQQENEVTGNTDVPIDGTTGQPAQTVEDVEGKGMGDGTLESAAAGSPWPESVSSIPRARLLNEKRHAYWERMRKAARLAGLPRGQGPDSAYVWATQQAEAEFPYVQEGPVEESQPSSAPEPAPNPVATEPVAAPAADLGVSGLGEIPANWPELPANAPLPIEIAWVTANRLKVRRGNGVDLSRALSPAPSYSALSWLETSILFPAKFADISVKATAETDDEKEFIRREKLAIEEIRSILKEMLDAKG